jgi:hypothetical protein
MNTFQMLNHALRRRRILKERFDIRREFEQIQETCIPSYLHWNPAAAAVAWYRLFSALDLYNHHVSSGPGLDFGAGCGEFASLLPELTPYDFIELDDRMADVLVSLYPKATRRTLAELPKSHYSVVFALDSLEHNHDFVSILDALIGSLSERGCLILSGPTENFLYRFGRRAAGFRGEYHKVTIYEIEQATSRELFLASRRLIPFGLPLFAVSAWKKHRRGEGLQEAQPSRLSG